MGDGLKGVHAAPDLKKKKKMYTPKMYKKIFSTLNINIVQVQKLCAMVERVHNFFILNLIYKKLHWYIKMKDKKVYVYLLAQFSAV